MVYFVIDVVFYKLALDNFLKNVATIFFVLCKNQLNLISSVTQ